MNRKQEILRRLSERDGFVSGQELCEMLGVSRTAVWKNINKLKEDGYPIEAVTNKGYRLLSVEEADILDREQISARLTTQWAGRPLIYKEETGSTNDDIFVLAAEGYPHGTLVVASRQSAGKGRRGRTWLSPKDGNVYNKKEKAAYGNNDDDPSWDDDPDNPLLQFDADKLRADVA